MDCSFCGTGIQKGTGKIFVKKTGKRYNFCSTKCEKNMIKLKRNPRKVNWTKEYHIVKQRERLGKPEAKAEKKAEEKKPEKKAEKPGKAKAKKATEGRKKAEKQGKTKEKKETVKTGKAKAKKATGVKKKK